MAFQRLDSLRTVGVSDQKSVAAHPLVAPSRRFWPLTALDFKNVVDHVFNPVPVMFRLNSGNVVKLHASAKSLDVVKRHVFHVLVVKVQGPKPNDLYREQKRRQG